MVSLLRISVFALTVFAGMLLVISGTSGPTAIYNLILQQLPNYIHDANLLTTASAITLILIAISSLGGFAVMIGGLFILRSHITLGRLLIGFGAGAGIPWLLLILFSLAFTQNAAQVIAQHSIIGWIGMIIAFIAKTMAK